MTNQKKQGDQAEETTQAREPLCLKIEQVMELLQIGREKYYELVGQHGLPAIHWGNGCVRIYKPALEAWLMRQSTGEREAAQVQPSAPLMTNPTTKPKGQRKRRPGGRYP